MLNTIFMSAHATWSFDRIALAGGSQVPVCPLPQLCRHAYRAPMPMHIHGAHPPLPGSPLPGMLSGQGYAYPCRLCPSNFLWQRFLATMPLCASAFRN